MEPTCTRCGQSRRSHPHFQSIPCSSYVARPPLIAFDPGIQPLTFTVSSYGANLSVPAIDLKRDVLRTAARTYAAAVLSNGLITDPTKAEKLDEAAIEFAHAFEVNLRGIQPQHVQDAIAKLANKPVGTCVGVNASTLHGWLTKLVATETSVTAARKLVDEERTAFLGVSAQLKDAQARVAELERAYENERRLHDITIADRNKAEADLKAARAARPVVDVIDGDTITYNGTTYVHKSKLPPGEWVSIEHYNTLRASLKNNEAILAKYRNGHATEDELVKRTLKAEAEAASYKAQRSSVFVDLAGDASAGDLWRRVADARPDTIVSMLAGTAKRIAEEALSTASARDNLTRIHRDANVALNQRRAADERAKRAEGEVAALECKLNAARAENERISKSMVEANVAMNLVGMGPDDIASKVRPWVGDRRIMITVRQFLQLHDLYTATHRAHTSTLDECARQRGRADELQALITKIRAAADSFV